MNNLDFILNRFSIENLETTIYNNFYIDKTPIYNYDESKKYLIKWKNKNNKYQNILLYIMYKDDIIYLVNYNKISKIYEFYEIMKNSYIDYRIFDFISSFGYLNLYS